ncbi:Uncharacterised protein [Mycobacteroides abscessus subsp. abscessus]|nr:Uncharacterised protein [Mycobacteroides abscessus subsp. abscessus]SIC71906.1 Uncharacterised protein [Mycobacteroides abscessus subsp. abscessus]
MVNIEPMTIPASTHGAAEPSTRLCNTVAKASSLPTNPRVSGTPAMLAAAIPAITSSGGCRLPSQASLRISRVPTVWSMIPTTMNSAALNKACAHSMTSPASRISGSPVPVSTTRNPSWLTVPKARISLRSYSRSARQPARIIVAIPKTRTTGRHGAASANPGDIRANR